MMDVFWKWFSSNQVAPVVVSDDPQLVLHVAVTTKSMANITSALSSDTALQLLTQVNHAHKTAFEVALDQLYFEGANLIFTSMQRLSEQQKKEIINRSLFEAARCGNVVVVNYLLDKNIEIEARPPSQKKQGAVKDCYRLIKKKMREQQLSKNLPVISNAHEDKDKDEDESNYSVQLVGFYVEDEETQTVTPVVNPQPKNTSVDTNSMDPIFGERPLHKAIKMDSSRNVTLLCDNGADAFLENKKGLSALEFSLKLGKQDIFNTLVKKVFNKSFTPRVQKAHYVKSDVMLDYVSNYLGANPEDRNTQLVNFFWNYFGKPFYETATREDKLKIAYFFKSLYIQMIDSNYVAQSQAPVQKTEHTLLAEKIIAYANMYNEKTAKDMIALNTKRYWLGYGASTFNTSLEKLIGVAAVKLSSTSGINDRHVTQLASFLETDTSFATQMKTMVKELHDLSQERSQAYNVNQKVDQALNKARI